MAMGHREKMRGGDEYDCFTSWKKVLGWRAGDRKKIKRRHNKRIRKQEVERLKQSFAQGWEEVLEGNVESIDDLWEE